MTHVVEGVTISDAALTQIIVGATEQVDGIRVRRRKGVEPHDGRVSLSVAARYGTVLPDAVHSVQTLVSDALTAMCDLRVEVDVSVDEVEA